MQSLARHLQAAGRGNDTVLVHMSPREVGGLQALAKAAGGSLTTNPTTGLPEAGFLENMLPTLAGIAGGAMGVDPWIAGLGGAAVQTAITGNLSKGLMAGLGAYGGATLGNAFLKPNSTQLLSERLGSGSSSGGGAPTAGAGGSGGEGWNDASPGHPLPGVTDASAPNVTASSFNAPTANITKAPAPGGLLDKFTNSALAGTGLDAKSSFAKMAPWAAALGVASPFLDSMGPQTVPYSPASSTPDPVYKGPYTSVPRKIIRNPYAESSSSEHVYFDDVNPYGVVPAAAAGGLVALADGGITTTSAPDLYGASSRGTVYGNSTPKTGKDYLALLNANAVKPTPYKDYTFKPSTTVVGEKDYKVVPPKGVDPSVTPIGGGESGNNNTTTLDPLATLPGTKVGDWMDVVGGGGGGGGGGSTDTGSSSTGVPPTTADPIKNPVVPKPKVATVEVTEDGVVVPPSGGGGNGGASTDNSAYDPSQYGSSAGYDYSNFTPPNLPAPTNNSSIGEESLGTLQQGGAKPSSGLDALTGNFLNTPKSWTGDNTLQAVINGVGYLPGGQLAGPLAGALEGFHVKDIAGDTGSGLGNIAGQSGFLQDMSRDATDWLYHNLFGGDYSAAEEVAPFNAAANEASAAVDKIYHGANNAILDGAYGVGNKSDTTFGALKAEMARLFGGDGPTFDNTQMGWTGEPLNTSLGGADLYTGMGANRFFGSEMSGDRGGAGTGPSVDDLNRWNALNTTGNRWEGARGGIVGYAEGGPVHLGNNSFVMDARTVSELGNGSSSAGQELLARLGGQPIHGPGDGVSDSIHASIGGKQEARVARDEVQFSPEAVARLGGGDTSKGSKFLYSLMAKARQARMEAAKKDGGRGVDTGLRALIGA